MTGSHPFKEETPPCHVVCANLQEKGKQKDGDYYRNQTRKKWRSPSLAGKTKLSDSQMNTQVACFEHDTEMSKK